MNQRNIEIFSAGCSACTDAIELINRIVCGSCSVEVLDMNDDRVSARARDLGIRSVPAVVIDGELADCCASGGIDEAALKAAGVGQPKG
ncbi:MAG: thioredoxin family protein [Polyangiaceae bacterium]